MDEMLLRPHLLWLYLLWQMDGVLAGAGAPETAPKAPNLTRSLSGDKPWRMYEESYTQALLYLLWLHDYLLWRVSEASYKHVLHYCQTTSYLLRFTMATFIFAMAGAARPPDHLRATRAAEPATGGVRRDAVREAAGGHAAARAAPLGRHRARGHTGGRRRLAPPRSGCVERLSAGTGTRARARVDGLRGHGIAAQGVWRCPAGRVQRPTERARPSRSIGRACSTATCWGACREGRINAGPTFLSDSVEALLLYFGVVVVRGRSFPTHRVVLHLVWSMVGAYYILLFILIPSESATARRSGRKERRNLAGTSWRPFTTHCTHICTT